MQSATAHSQSVHQSSPLLLSGRFILRRSDPEPCDSDPRLARVDHTVVDEIEPGGHVEDSRLPEEESELVSDALSAYIPRGEEKAADGVDASMLA